MFLVLFLLVAESQFVYSLCQEHEQDQHKEVARLASMNTQALALLDDIEIVLDANSDPVGRGRVRTRWQKSGLLERVDVLSEIPADNDTFIIRRQVVEYDHQAGHMKLFATNVGGTYDDEPEKEMQLLPPEVGWQKTYEAWEAPFGRNLSHNYGLLPMMLRVSGNALDEYRTIEELVSESTNVGLEIIDELPVLSIQHPGIEGKLEDAMVHVTLDPKAGYMARKVEVVVESEKWFIVYETPSFQKAGRGWVPSTVSVTFGSIKGGERNPTGSTRNFLVSVEGMDSGLMSARKFEFPDQTMVKQLIEPVRPGSTGGQTTCDVVVYFRDQPNRKLTPAEFPDFIREKLLQSGSGLPSGEGDGGPGDQGSTGSSFFLYPAAVALIVVLFAVVRMLFWRRGTVH